MPVYMQYFIISFSILFENVTVRHDGVIHSFNSITDQASRVNTLNTR